MSVALPLDRRRHKFNAIPTTVENIRFASSAEAGRYLQLRLLEKAGEITDLQRQPKFPLCAPGPPGKPLDFAALGEYRADFAYVDKLRGDVIEDVKGYDVPFQRWKRKHAEAQYGITVDVIRNGRLMTRAKRKARR